MDAITLRQIRYFVSVARAGSFTAASGGLNVSQPAVGLQVKQLEGVLGRPVFRRHSRGVRLTEAGAAYLPFAERVLETLAEAETAMARHRDAASVTLRLGVTPTVAHTILPALLYRSAQPDSPFRVEFVEGVTETLLPMLETGQLDAAFGYGPEGVPLYDERLCVVGPPEVLPARAGEVTLAELARLPLVLSPAPNPLRDLVDAAAGQVGVTLAPVVELNLAGLKRDFLLRYGYCALSPRGLFIDDLRSGRLVGLPLAHPEIRRVIRLTCASGLDPTRAARLVETVRAVLESDIDHAELLWCPER